MALPERGSSAYGWATLISLVLVGLLGLAVFNAKVVNHGGGSASNASKPVHVTYASQKAKAGGVKWKDPADGTKAKAKAHNATLTLTFDDKGKLVAAKSNPKGAFKGEGNEKKFTLTAHVLPGSPLYAEVKTQGATGEYRAKGGEAESTRTGGLPPKPDGQPYRQIVWYGWV
jgi:hypothetical protein